MAKQNWELFTNIFYGAIVNQMLETSNTKTANEQLKKIGQEMGPRMLENYCSQFNTQPSQDPYELLTLIKSMLQYFFDCGEVEISEKRENSSAHLRLERNLLEDYVEVPPQFQKLEYCNVLPGIVEGIS